MSNLLASAQIYAPLLCRSDLRPAFTHSRFRTVKFTTRFQVPLGSVLAGRLCLAHKLSFGCGRINLFSRRNLYDIRRLCLSLAERPFTTINNFRPAYFSSNLLAFDLLPAP